jgi:excisionase family DNA binding protein
MNTAEFNAIMTKLDKLTSQELPELMTPVEVAKYMKVHVNTVINKMGESDFAPVIKIGRQNRFRRRDILAYVERSVRKRYDIPL